MNVRDKVKAYLQKCQPCGDQYVILPEIREEIEGLAMPDDNKEEYKQQRGEIVAKGKGILPEDGTERQPMEFNVGDIVLFQRYAGNDFWMDEKYVIYPSHEEQREGLVATKVLRQDSILLRLP